MRYRCSATEPLGDHKRDQTKKYNARIFGLLKIFIFLTIFQFFCPWFVAQQGVSPNVPGSWLHLMCKIYYY